MNSCVSLKSMADLAAREALMQELADIPPLSELEKIYTTSEQHDKKIKKVLKREKRLDNLTKVNKAVSKAAVVMLICITVVMTPLISAKAVRESIAQTVIEWKNEFSRIFIKSDDVCTTINNVEIGYLPEGYTLDGEPEFDEGKYSLTFTNNNNNLYIIVYSDTNYYTTYLDNITSDYCSVIIDDCNGIWICTYDMNALVIAKDNYSYHIEGYASIEDLIKIFKNIKVF